MTSPTSMKRFCFFATTTPRFRSNNKFLSDTISFDKSASCRSSKPFPFGKTSVCMFFIIALSIALSSCSNADDIIDGLDKLAYQSYLRNESGRDVTVIMRPSRHLSQQECTWFVPKDSVVEIPDTEKWGLMQRVYESDTVFFRFSDGTSVLHYYTTENYPSDKHIFVPKENNIFCTGLGIPEKEDTWTSIKIRPQKYRYEYVIK